MLSVPWDLFVQVAVCGQTCYHAYIVVVAEATTESAISAGGGASPAWDNMAMSPAMSAITSVLTTYLAPAVRTSIVLNGCAPATKIVPNRICWNEEEL